MESVIGKMLLSLPLNGECRNGFPRGRFSEDWKITREQPLLSGPRQPPAFRWREFELQLEIAAEVRNLTVMKTIGNFLDASGTLQSGERGF